MTEELLKALQLIKAECEKHSRCEGCPMIMADDECGIRETHPAEWSLKKREVWFYG